MTTSIDLLASADDLPRHEVERLLSVASGRSWTELLLGIDLDDDATARFDELAARRRAGEPLQYIEGRLPFGPIDVSVDPRVLVPRPETEQLFELAVSESTDPHVIVDLCTGSGNLALALKHTFPQAVVHATDISTDAVQVAESNARDAGLEIEVSVGDLFDPLPRHLEGKVDLIVANPPYLAERELADLPVDVRDHEPVAALVAGANGDEVLARIAEESGRWLRPGGVVVCEIGEFHGPAIAGHFASLGGEVFPDLNGRDRFIVGRVPAAE